MMEMDEYATRSAQTAIYPDKFNLVGNVPGIIYNGLGLAGEAGELANQVKKIVRDDNGVLTPGRREKLIDEVGDLLWYAAAMCRELRIPLSVVALKNLQKLADRKAANALAGSGESIGERTPVETFGASEASPGRYPDKDKNAALNLKSDHDRQAVYDGSRPPYDKSVHDAELASLANRASITHGMPMEAVRIPDPENGGHRTEMRPLANVGKLSDEHYPRGSGPTDWEADARTHRLIRSSDNRPSQDDIAASDTDDT